MEKRIFCFISILILLSCTGNRSYVMEDFEHYTNISKYKVKSKIFLNNQSRVEVELSDTTKQNLANRFHFVNYDEFKKILFHDGRVSYNKMYNFTVRDTNYLYYIRDGDAQFEYFILLLSKKNNFLIFCENFRSDWQ